MPGAAARPPRALCDTIAFAMLRRSLIIALIATLLITGLASAHADLVRSDPAANATLAAAPDRITLDFSEAIEPAFSKITVLFEDGQAADNGDSTVSPVDPKQLSVTLKEARQGTYVVSWRVLSAVDGHITSGAYVFSVGKPINQTVGADSGGAVTSPIDMLARALTFVGQALIAGLVAFRWLVWRPALNSAQLGDDVDDHAVRLNQRLLWVALGLAGVGAAIALVSQVSLNATTIPDWLGTRVGRVWIGRVTTLIAIAVLSEDFAAAGRGRLITNLAVVWLAGQVLFLTTLTSHSAAVASPPLWPFVADFAHLIATSVWVGGLVSLAVIVPRVARRAAEDDRAWLWLKVVVYFSTVAALALGVILITGTYLSFLHVGSWSALITTAYGRALLFKLALAAAAMLAGAFNLLVIKPRLDRAIDEPAIGPRVQRRFRRTVAVEALFGALVLAAAGVLTDLPRSIDPQPVTAAAPLTLTTRADNLDVALTIDPARSGASKYVVRADENGQPIGAAANVSLRFTYLTRGLGTQQAAAAPDGDGAYTANGAYLSLPGEWQIEVAVRRPGAFDAFAAYRVKIDLDGRIVPAGEEGLFDQLVRWLSIYGLAFGGVVAIGLGLIWIVIGFKAARNTLSQALLMIPVLLAVPIGIWSVVTFANEATPGLTLTNPFLPDEASLKIGQELFAQNCAVCHGEQGRGNGPAAAGLSLKPPDFGNGHLDIHTDGDVFYWIQNGLSPTSPMPAFKGKLSDDQIWHLVNYVRRLRNEAGSSSTSSPASQSPADLSLPPTVLQPYTPPSFIADQHGATGPITPTGEIEALGLLAQSDAAMNALTSMSEDQQVRDDTGQQLIVQFDFNAPDRMQYQVVGGPRSVQIGAADYQPAPDGSWYENARGTAFAWPNFFYARVAQNARLDGTDTIGGQPASKVVFRYNDFDFRVWIDAETHRIVRLTIDGADLHVSSTYHAFDSAPRIEAPIK